MFSLSLSPARRILLTPPPPAILSAGLQSLRSRAYSFYVVQEGTAGAGGKKRSLKFAVDKETDTFCPVLDKQKEEQKREKDAVLPFSLSPSASSGHDVSSFLSNTVSHFLPKGYPRSVTPSYGSYVKWTMIASTASSVSGVLSMQSLLYAIGLGAGAIPMAAALNWVIKDGIGQFGGVIFASFVNQRFDADPKRWRMVSAIALDLSTLLEVLSPLFPAYFLPIASIANVGKNVSWLSASATRAAVHQSFLKQENLADVTAKAGSQTIVSSIVGTGIGIGLSPLIGPSTSAVLCAFLLSSALHLTCTFKSLGAVVLPTINQQGDYFINLLRLFIIVDGYIDHDTVSPPDLVSKLFALHQGILQLERYIIHLDERKRVTAFFLEGASNEDIFRGYLHLRLLERRLQADEENQRTGDREYGAEKGLQFKLVEETYKALREENSSGISFAQRFVDLLLESEWHTSHLLLDDTGRKIRIVED